MLLSPVATAESGGSFSGSDSLSLGTPAGEAVMQTSDIEPSNTSNTSSRHIGPELTQNEPSAEIVISEAEARVGSRLLNSTDALQAGQFDTAETTISGNTTDLLRQYERLAAQTESTADDEIAQEFNLTVQQQRELIGTARNSSSIYNEYQLARANGNQTRARQLARTLLKQTQDGNQTAERLTNQYEKLANETDLNATQTLTEINDAQARLAEIQDTVRSETLTPTSLRVSTPAAASPTQPMDISGTLSSNNSQLTNKTIKISLGDRTVQTKTNEAGEFNASLRPLMIASGQQTVSVQFIPETTSIYDGQRVEKSIQIDSISPTADIQYSPSHVQFNETVVINGEVDAGQVPLSDVPVTTTIAGRPFKSVRTDHQGNFRISESLPATIPNGSQQIDVVISKQNVAVQPTIKTGEIYVNLTETELSFTSIQTDGSNITFVGQLTTTEGTELSDRRISISQGNSSSVVSYTNQSGYFDGSTSMEATSDISQLLFSPDKHTLTARYDSTGENLEPSTQTTMVSYSSPISMPLQQIGFVGLTVAAIIYAVSVWRRRESKSNGSEDELSGVIDSEAALPTETVEEASPDKLLSHAKKYHDAGNVEAAAGLGYVALRKKHMKSHDVARSLTHWELCRTLRSELDSSSHELLYEVTEIYERVLFSDKKFVSNSELDIIFEKLTDVITNENESNLELE
ncbi:hypothetical protein [Halohasta salina]|uniref:hypothetical protein n=1 Tax=Halohasta salina TaxID=2961621 RepID=UPI0020A2A03A|nr:hypothetical protein [Halohasta salina]